VKNYGFEFRPLHIVMSSPTEKYLMNNVGSKECVYLFLKRKMLVLLICIKSGDQNFEILITSYSSTFFIPNHRVIFIPQWGLYSTHEIEKYFVLPVM